MSIGGVAVARTEPAPQAPSSPAPAPLETLRSSSSPEALELAASALARSADRRDLDLLGQFLRDDGFLARLDKPGGPRNIHLGRVMAVLAGHPTPQAAELCLLLAENPAYLDDADRTGFLLEALAAVKPMSERAALWFQRTNEAGYFALNAPLLASNGSPRALALFESMMLERDVPVDRRIDSLHFSIVQRRIELPVLRAAGRILSRSTEPELCRGVIESVFDYQPRWFGTAVNSTSPPAWQSASDESLRFASDLADTSLSRRDLNPGLREKVVKARAAIAQALTARQK